MTLTPPPFVRPAVRLCGEVPGGGAEGQRVQQGEPEDGGAGPLPAVAPERAAGAARSVQSGINVAAATAARHRDVTATPVLESNGACFLYLMAPY